MAQLLALKTGSHPSKVKEDIISKTVPPCVRLGFHLLFLVLHPLPMVLPGQLGASPLGCSSLANLCIVQ